MNCTFGTMPRACGVLIGRWRLLLSCACGVLLLGSGIVLQAQTPREAQAALEKLIAQHPRDVGARLAYANFLADQDDSVGARAAWLDAQKLAPQSGFIAQALGESELRLGNILPALAAYQRANELEPQNALHHFSMANVLFLFRRQVGLSEPEAIRQAMSHFSRAAELDALNEDYARGYAETFYAVPGADWNAAQTAWEHVADLSAKKDYAWLNLARVRLRAGDPTGARRWLGKVADPNLRDIKNKLEKQAAALSSKASPTP